MPSSSSLRFVISYCAILLALLVLPSPGVSQDAPPIPGLKEGILGALKGTKFERPRVGRTVLEGLQAARKYSTFLKIVERAHLRSLLDGTVIDSTRLTFEFISDSVGGVEMSTSSLTIRGLPQGMSETESKGQVMDRVKSGVAEVLTSLIAEPDRVTVFSPTNAALEKLPKARLDTLLHDSTAAREFVRAHILNRGVYRDAFGKIRTMTSLGGLALTPTVTSKGVVLNGSIAIIESDIAGDNGVAHGIEAVLEAQAPSTPKP